MFAVIIFSNTCLALISTYEEGLNLYANSYVVDYLCVNHMLLGYLGWINFVLYEIARYWDICLDSDAFSKGLVRLIFMVLYFVV